MILELKVCNKYDYIYKAFEWHNKWQRRSSTEPKLFFFFFLYSVVFTDWLVGLVAHDGSAWGPTLEQVFWDFSIWNFLLTTRAMENGGGASDSSLSCWSSAWSFSDWIGLPSYRITKVMEGIVLVSAYITYKVEVEESSKEGPSSFLPCL